MKRITILAIFISPLLILSAFIGVLHTEASVLPPTGGVTFTVNSTIDAIDANPGDGVCETVAGNGVCTLRAAVMESNVLSGEDNIILPTNMYTLTIPGQFEDNAETGDLDILDRVSIIGESADTTIINGNKLDRVFHNYSNLFLTNMTIFNGDSQSEGGGISNEGILQLTHINVISNTNSGIHNSAQFTGQAVITATDIIVANNIDLGNNGAGGIYSNVGVVTITSSIIENNYTPVRGGGLYLAKTSTWLNDVTIRNNQAGLYGGGVHLRPNWVDSSSTFIKNSHIISNIATYEGGGIFFTMPGGLLELSNVDIRGNRLTGAEDTYGGGIYVRGGNLTIIKSSIHQNFSPVSGGGIYQSDSYGDKVIIQDSVVHNNIALESGAGIFNDDEMVLQNVTLSRNGSITETLAGGAIFNDTGLLTISHTTVFSNRAASGGGIYQNVGEVFLFSTIIAGNTNSNCTGLFTSSGYNLEDTTSCSLTNTGDITNTIPLLGPLQDNGGNTLTHQLLENSPAIDAGTNGGCPATDQRGIARPLDGNGDHANICDIGSFEYLNLSPAPSISDASIVESESEFTIANFIVDLVITSTLPITVNYTTADLTATAHLDYTPISGTLTFTPGELTKTLQVPIIDDELDEPDEAFAVNLSNPINATIADGQGIGTIIDDDDAPGLTISDAAVSEGDGMATFVVTLTAVSAQPITVTYQTADLIAIAHLDYTPVSGTLTFAPGELTKTLQVPIIGDELDEPDETFTVNLSNPVNAAIADGQGIGTIVDDDDEIQIGYSVYLPFVMR